MLFHSTNDGCRDVTFPEAIVNGIAPDGGLYMPQALPVLPKAFFNNISEMSLKEIAYVVCNALFGTLISSSRLKQLVDDALPFEIPVKKFGEREGVYAVELFHGPTMSFKDVGARFMARLLPILVPQRKEFTILLATSGDSGGAIANAFSADPDARVVILFPRGELSKIHLAMFAGYPRVKAVEVGGTFDDCQALVKQALLDKEFNSQIPLTSGNSINLARQLPSIIYYFHAYAKARAQRPDAHDVVMSIPCGNLGNLSAALMALKMGLPVKRFVGANNANDTFVEYLRTGGVHPRRALITLARAMDVGNPSNLARIIDLYGGDLDRLRRDVEGVSFSDQEIIATIRKTYVETGQLLDPQTATAFRALDNYGDARTTALFLATGHPAKFPTAITGAVGSPAPLPDHPARVLRSGAWAGSTKIPPTLPALQRIIRLVR